MTNVLVVDDSDVDRLLMEGLLGQAEGFVVIAAENGVQALKKLEEWSVDIILTDLQMPKMDGLELVKQVRANKLEIPVILTTGVGSEEIAAQALRAGAAGYIPKSKLNQMLVSSIREVLEILNSNQNYNRLLNCSKVSHFEFELDNDPTLIPLLVDFCEQMLKSLAPLDRIDCLRIAVAVDHALQNALYRGNLEIDSEQNIQGFSAANMEELPQFVQERFEQEPYKNRVTNVVIEIKSNGFAVRIRDEGPGFDTSDLDDWNELAFRGTNLMRAFMDSVQYNDKGNEVKMVYRFDRSKIQKKPAQRVSARPGGRLVCQVTGEVYDISDRKFVIGRRSACHLKLQGANIAPLHCMLVNDDDQVMLLNLSPEYETLVNGKAGNGSQLKKGDLIRVGEHTFRFETNGS
jgi:CheY-like chemotaxis protein